MAIFQVDDDGNEPDAFVRVAHKMPFKVRFVERRHA